MTSLYTVTNEHGQINGSIFTNTKSNAEILAFVQKWRTVRLQAGKERLQRYEGDGGADRSVWNEVFSDNLSEGVRPYKPPRGHGLVHATMKKDKFSHICSYKNAKAWSLAHAMAAT